MAIKFYKFNCEICNWSRISNGSDITDLVEVKRSKIQKSIPIWDNFEKKIVTKSFQEQPKMFKCPNCGRSVTPKKIMNPQGELEKKLAEEESARKLDEDRKKALAEAEERIKARHKVQIALDEEEAENRRIRRETANENKHRSDGSQTGVEGF